MIDKRRSLVTAAVAATIAFGLTAMAAPVSARQTSEAAPSGATTAPPPAAAPAEPAPRVTLDFKDIGFKGALMLLFQNTRLTWSLGPDLPNTPVTLSLKDQDFDTALRALLHAGSTSAVRLQYVVDRNGYRVTAVPTGDESGALPTWKLPLKNVTVESALAALKQFPGTEHLWIAASANDNTLLLKGTPQEAETVRQALRTIDVAPIPIKLRANITFITPQGKRQSLCASTLYTQQDQEATITMESQPESTSAKTRTATGLSISVQPHQMPGGRIAVTSKWNITLPASAIGGSPGRILIYKLARTTSLVVAGSTALVGEISGDQWGAPGRLLLELTAPPSSPR